MLKVSIKKTWKEFRLKADFEIPHEKITALFGPSGSGKSSILRLISGLERADGGMIHKGEEVWYDESKAINIIPQQRSVGFVFQDFALFPHLTVERNVTYGIKEKKRLKEAKDLLSLAGLSGYERYYPAQLSGGQKQRVALIRALARRPDILLLDEPLSALDWETRRQLQEDLKRIIQQLRITTLYVTHDVTEVYKLADYVIVLESGKVVKRGTPEEIFMGRRLSTRIQVVGKVVDIESDSIMAAVTVMHEDQYFKTLIDTEEVRRLNLVIGDDVVIGAKSSDVILCKVLTETRDVLNNIQQIA
ncbi:MAG: ATP-binding cassette domain-containing protein [Planctomycetia bacterium]|mgnify:CR=1 FL=1|nr:ATP-binding cassette domain-containing protein [Candidatus Brocadia sp.]QOJ07449.1 MAG: ATP-binding cassette domain-containing protein [Planctomycetia bacterium]TVL97536.1 MAG: molybdenum ABC transporter ATP-binding protein [Candidatus Brocadia sp. BL1]HQU31539.1 ATP-binding cassette domain-containing protein [Candidatus Brocadia sapporoensis]